MDRFLAGPALGDRWVPFHTVTCEQELFLMTELRTAPDLDDRQKFVLATCYSASRESLSHRRPPGTPTSSGARRGHRHAPPGDSNLQRRPPRKPSVDARRGRTPPRAVLREVARGDLDDGQPVERRGRGRRRPDPLGLRGREQARERLERCTRSSSQSAPVDCPVYLSSACWQMRQRC